MGVLEPVHTGNKVEFDTGDYQWSITARSVVVVSLEPVHTSDEVEFDAGDSVNG